MLESTVRAAAPFAAGKALAAGVISSRVAILIEEVLKTMFMTKLKLASVAVLLIGAAGAAGVLAQPGAGSDANQAKDQPQGPAAAESRRAPGVDSAPAPAPAYITQSRAMIITRLEEEVAEARARLDRTLQHVRSPDDPAVVRARKTLDELQQRLDRIDRVLVDVVETYPTMFDFSGGPSDLASGSQPTDGPAEKTEEPRSRHGVEDPTETDLARAKDRLEWVKRVFDRGYVSKSQLEAAFAKCYEAQVAYLDAMKARDQASERQQGEKRGREQNQHPGAKQGQKGQSQDTKQGLQQGSRDNQPSGSKSGQREQSPDSGQGQEQGSKENQQSNAKSGQKGQNSKSKQVSQQGGQQSGSKQRTQGRSQDGGLGGLHQGDQQSGAPGQPANQQQDKNRDRRQPAPGQPANQQQDKSRDRAQQAPGQPANQQQGNNRDRRSGRQDNLPISSKATTVIGRSGRQDNLPISSKATTVIGRSGRQDNLPISRKASTEIAAGRRQENSAKKRERTHKTGRVETLECEIEKFQRG